MFPKMKNLELHQAKFFRKYPKYLTKQLSDRSISEPQNVMDNIGLQKKDFNNKKIVLF